MSTKRIIYLIITSILIVVFSLLFFRVRYNSYYSFNFQTIDGNMVYRSHTLPGVMCDTMYPGYTIIYETENYRYTTSDLLNNSGCSNNYYIRVEGNFMSFDTALQEGILSESDLSDFNFRVEINQREYFDNITSIRQYISPTSDEPHLIYQEDDAEFLEYSTRITHLSFQSEEEYTTTDVKYFIAITTNDITKILEVHEGYIVELSTGNISFINEHSYWD